MHGPLHLQKAGQTLHSRVQPTIIKHNMDRLQISLLILSKFKQIN